MPTTSGRGSDTDFGTSGVSRHWRPEELNSQDATAPLKSSSENLLVEGLGMLNGNLAGLFQLNHHLCRDPGCLLDFLLNQQKGWLTLCNGPSQLLSSLLS